MAQQESSAPPLVAAATEAVKEKKKKKRKQEEEAAPAVEESCAVTTKEEGVVSKKEKKRKKDRDVPAPENSTAAAVADAITTSVADAQPHAETEKKKKKKKNKADGADATATTSSQPQSSSPAASASTVAAEDDVLPSIKPAKSKKSANKISAGPAASDDTISPITNRPLSKNALKILAKRKKLPCWPMKDHFLDLVANNQVTVLVGETGSGKTTQMPQFLAEVYGSSAKKIAVTQPRRVAAMSVATRVAEEMDVELGEECGYLIRFEDKTSDKTVVKYMTDGMLLRECMTDPLLSNYSVICLDEAHERTLSTDILFGLLKRVLRERRDLKVVVMSATLEAEKFQKYFSANMADEEENQAPSENKSASDENTPHVPLLTVSGRMFPVELHYTQGFTRNYVEASVDKVVKCIEEEKAERGKESLENGGERTDEPLGDVLVFLTGEDEIENCCRMLEEQLPEDEVVVLPLYSSLPPNQQRKVFQDFAKQGLRKIVVATNVAETSITIDGVVYVVDCGLVKMKVYNPRTHVESLLVQPISQAAAKQRAGRAGRTRPGKCYRLYTETAFKESLEESSVPEILRTNLSSALLTLLNLGVEDVVHFDWMDPPSPECMMRALDLLLQLNAVNDECELTATGKILAEFPLDPQLGKCLIASAKHGVLKQMSAVIALLSGAPCHLRPRMYAKQADRAHKAFQSTCGDHGTLLKIFEEFEANQKTDKNWCYDNYLKDRSLISAQSVQRQLLRLCEKMQVSNSQEITEGNVKIALRRALIAGFFLQTAHISGKHYVTVKDKQIVEIHPGSQLEHKPEWILYHELVLTDKNYLRNCTALRPQWLVEEAPMFFPGKVANDEVRKGLEKFVKK
ncbi:unnamed protein product [Amoebophrya sp. A120]|nr:unnamed protein product [Amoebophrya sp. A120]|eukprot:GSA120T00012510001.1